MLHLILTGDLDVVLPILSLNPELFNTVGVHLELLVTKFVVRLVSRDVGVKIENTLVWSLQITKEVVNVHVVDAGCGLSFDVAAVLSLLCLTSGTTLGTIEQSGQPGT